MIAVLLFLARITKTNRHVEVSSIICKHISSSATRRRYARETSDTLSRFKKLDRQQPTYVSKSRLFNAIETRTSSSSSSSSSLRSVRVFVLRGK